MTDEVNLNVIVGNQYNPYLNLSVESFLADSLSKDTVTMFLWKNRQTIVIGANQNPYAECDVDLILGENGFIARRRTGGGAVYHDLGNLNFSFVAENKVYDVKRQCSVIQRSLLDFGLKAELSGRNDILINGRKFSGNAFHKGREQSLHHGTILIKTDTEKMQRYLKINPLKIRKHGVKSVSSRVVNLSELADITSENIIPSLINAFEEVYGQRANVIDFDALCTDKVLENKKRIEGHDYIFGKWDNFTSQLHGAFPWGLVDIELRINENAKTIEAAKISSDCLVVEAIEKAEDILNGASVNMCPEIIDSENGDIIKDILSLVY